LQAHFQFDCINFHQPFAAGGVLTSRRARPIAKIYTCHSLSGEEFESRNQRPAVVFPALIHQLNRRIRMGLDGWALKSSDSIVVLSRYAAEKLRRVHGLAGRRALIIPGGVDGEQFHPGQAHGLHP
jgi:hypothetical protein